MIAGTPAAIAARNGGSSMRSRRARSTSMMGRPTCESTVAAPWPGKCFAQHRKPAAEYARIAAPASAETRCGSDPYERLPMIGLSGSLFTSATGAKFQFTPLARSSSAVMVAARCTAATGSGVAARAIWPGNTVMPLPMRATEPPS